MGGGIKNRQESGGFALVVVILVMLITSFLASQLIMQVRTDLKISANQQQRVVGRMLAEGGVNLAVFRLLDKPGVGFAEKLGGEIFLHGKTYETSLPTGKIEYYATDESGKIDLNRTNIDLLKKFLEYHGLGEEGVAVVIDSLLDWRDSDDLHRINGAEKSYYEGLDNPYIPRNGKIEDPAEFFLIRGTESLRGRFDPAAVFTVNNNSGKININNLSPDMLTFLVGGDVERGQKYREAQDLAENGRVTRGMMQEIVAKEVYSSLGHYLVDSLTTGRFCSIVAYGYPGNSLQEATEGETVAAGGEDNLARHRPATKVRVLVDIVKEKFQYLTWREQPL